jgi:hypothetical protein
MSDIKLLYGRHQTATRTGPEMPLRRLFRVSTAKLMQESERATTSTD